MGKRGPKSTAEKILKQTSVQASWTGTPPWKKPNLALWEQVVEFINVLPITSGKLAGQRMKLRPWQEDIVKKLFVTDADGRRLVRTAIFTVPRKNGKTQLAAALILAAMGDGPLAESRGQCFSMANDRGQAAIIFNELEAWIFAVPEFTENFNIKRHEKKIECLHTGSTYNALSRDGRKAHGLSPSMAIYDEAAQSYDSNLWDNVTSGTGARENPLCMIISTQAADDLHWFSGLIDYGRKIKSGDLPPDDSFCLVEYSAPMDADIWDPETWANCNPALGDFRSKKELEQFADKAKKIPAMESVFRNLYLNQRVDSNPAFIPREAWAACSGTGETTGPCYGGFDLGSSQDLTALALYWPDTGAVKVFSWLPGEPSLRERGEQHRAPFHLWGDQGYIETWPGPVTDHRAAAYRLAEISMEYDIRGMAFDRWRIDQFKLILDDIGCGVEMIPWGQGYKDMSPAVEALEKSILSKHLKHGDNPVLTWCISNVIIAIDPAGNRKIVKGRSIKKVDPVVALAMAIGLSEKIRVEGPPDFEFTLETL